MFEWNATDSFLWSNAIACVRWKVTVFLVPVLLPVFVWNVIDLNCICKMHHTIDEIMLLWPLFFFFSNINQAKYLLMYYIFYMFVCISCFIIHKMLWETVFIFIPLLKIHGYFQWKRWMKNKLKIILEFLLILYVTIKLHIQLLIKHLYYVHSYDL